MKTDEIFFQVKLQLAVFSKIAPFGTSGWFFQGNKLDVVSLRTSKIIPQREFRNRRFLILMATSN